MVTYNVVCEFPTPDKEYSFPGAFAHSSHLVEIMRDLDYTGGDLVSIKVVSIL